MTIYRYVGNKNPSDGTSVLSFRSVEDGLLYSVSKGQKVDLSSQDYSVLSEKYEFFDELGQSNVVPKDDDISNQIFPLDIEGSLAEGQTFKRQGNKMVPTSLANAPDAANEVKGVIRLAGALGGTADNPTVPALTSKANKNSIMKSALEHGIVSDGTTDNASAIESLSPGTYFFPEGTYALARRTQVPNNVNFHGAGSSVTNFKSTSSSGGLAFGTHDVGNEGGLCQGFTIDGNLIGVEPFYMGLAVGRSFVDVRSLKASGTSLYLDGSQNNSFTSCEFGDCSGSGVIFDMGAGSNIFIRSEVFKCSKYFVELVETGKYGTNRIGSSNLNNAFVGGVFEYAGGWSFNQAGQQLGCILNEASAYNTFSNLSISNSDVSGAKPIVLTKSNIANSANGNLLFNGCAFYGSASSTIFDCAGAVNTATLCTLTGDTSFNGALNAFRFSAGVVPHIIVSCYIRRGGVTNWFVHADSPDYEPLIIGSPSPLYGVFKNRSTLGTVIGAQAVHNSDGILIGYMPVYNNIT